MDNRIDHRFLQLRKQGSSGFMAYITGGDPTLDRTVDIAIALSAAGVDFLEIGFRSPTLWRMGSQINSVRSGFGGGRHGPETAEDHWPIFKKLRVFRSYYTAISTRCFNTDSKSSNATRPWPEPTVYFSWICRRMKHYWPTIRRKSFTGFAL